MRYCLKLSTGRDRRDRISSVLDNAFTQLECIAYLLERRELMK